MACRPLIFVGHSLGGLVIEEVCPIYTVQTLIKDVTQAITVSHGSQQDHLRSLVEATYAICFMGTPHLGADLANWGTIAFNFANLLSRTNRNIVKVLKPNSEVLASLQQRFHTLLEQRRKDGKMEIEMYCFHEELGYKGIGLVTMLCL